ncbi:MAG: choice-of-anchor tandem repeat NxxGxxAF-containing protein [Acidobacteriota bacterium]
MRSGCKSRRLLVRCAVGGLIVAGFWGVSERAIAGTLTVILSAGTAAPDGSGELSSFERAVIDASGNAVVPATIRDNGFYVKNALFRVGPVDALEMIVAEGDPSPDGNGNFNRLETPRVTRNGALAFINVLEGTLGGFSDAPALFVGRDQPLAIAARSGQAIPDAPGDALGFTLIDHGVTDGGSIGFFDVSAVDELPATWRADGTAGGLVRVVTEGDRNPSGDGILAGGTVLPPAQRLGPGGHYAFHDAVRLDSGEFLSGIFRALPSGTLQKVARLDDPAPGGDGTYASFFNLVAPVSGALAINGHGEVAFAAVLEGTSGGATDNVALYLGRPSGTIELVRKGDLVPDGNGSFLALGNDGWSVSSRGEVLFSARVSGATGGASEGLFVAGPGGVRQVARLNQEVPGGGVITAIDGSRAINGAGAVAFYAFIDDGGPSSVEVLFYAEDGVLMEVLREGESVPGVGTVTGIRPGGADDGGVDCPSRCMMNERGEVVTGFGAGGGDRLAIWRPASLLFVDGFESGNLGGWSSSQSLPVSRSGP